MSIDESWLDRSTAWWAKLDRAAVHLGSLRQEVDAYRAAKPYEVVPEPTGTPGRTVYRARVRQEVPVAISTILGDIVHNLRSALDSLAYGMALRHLGRSLTTAELKASAFPVRESPDEFNKFFEEPPVRGPMYGDLERAAFRTAQPFWGIAAAGDRDPASYADKYRRDKLRRLNELSNLDKHRRLAVLGWVFGFPFWPSGAQTQRRWTQGERRLVDGAVIGYMAGSDPEVGDAVFHEFNLVIADDPIMVDNDDPTFAGYDAVRMLEGWRHHVRVVLTRVVYSLG